MTEKAKKIACFASGSGTNFQALLDKVHGQSAQIAALFTDSLSAHAIKRAEGAGVPVFAFDWRAAGREAFWAAACKELERIGPSALALCGFVRALPAEALLRWPAINVHPSLLPSFSGKGMYGMRVHEAAIAYGVKVSGCTVHFAAEELDAGPVIFQKAVPVAEGETAEGLQKKVLAEEHALLPEAIRLFCEGRLRVSGRTVTIAETGAA
jgi:phosphoribosylglycinamide formyltransferase-1